MEIRIGRLSRMNGGAMDDTVSVISEDFKSHYMTNILSNANPATFTFLGFRREGGFLQMVVNLLPPMEA